MIFKSPEELVGGTPLVELSTVSDGLSAKVFAKLEYMNLTGSVKDRAAKNMLDDAERRGVLKPGATVIEPTSGNTGIGLAAIGVPRGYRVIIVMPDTMSEERMKLMRAYGAELVLTPGALGMKGAIARAEELAEEIEGAFIPAQFDNPANSEAHYLTTAPEIYSDLEGRVDVFVAGIGTGGTISGISKYLKERNPALYTVGIEPSDSAVLTGGTAGAHKLQGIGAGFVPSVLERELVDEVVTVTTEEAYDTVRTLAKTTGILVGISSGAALYAALEVAKREEYRGKNVVVLLPDGGSRYLSTPDLF